MGWCGIRMECGTCRRPLRSYWVVFGGSFPSGGMLWRATSFALHHLENGLLVENRHTEFLRLVTLRAAAFTGEDEVGFRGDGTADLAALGLDEFLHRVAVHAKGAGDDEGFTGQRQGGEVGLCGNGEVVVGNGID